MAYQYGGSKIKLTKGLFAQVDESDFEYLSMFKWHAAKGGKYAAAVRNGRIVYMHRLIMNAREDMEVDHINGDGLDNRKLNLRLCTSAQNHYNHKLLKTNTSGYRGVSKTRFGTYHVSISVNDKTLHLGNYKNIIEAAKAHDDAVKRYRGEFAVPNFKGGMYGL